MDILCVGQLVTDILVRPVDNIDFNVDTLRVNQIALKPGGDCLNTAICLSRLGNPVGFAGKVGNDEFGFLLLNTLISDGIDIRGLRVEKDSATSSVIVLINHAGERTFLYHGGTNDSFQYEDVDTSLIGEAKIVHIGGTFMLPGFDGTGAARILRMAKERGKYTSMDVSYDTSGKWLEIIHPCLKYLDFFMPSLNEARFITGKKKPEDIADFLKREGVGTVVIKLGSDGCYVDGKENAFFMPAYEVEVIDTTGAGDTFVAGFLTGILKNWSLKKCAQFANAVSAHCVCQLGATTGIPGFSKIIEFIENRGRLYEG